MTSDQTHVIVGASLAGAKAAETLREEGFDGRVVLVGAEQERPYERPPLSKDYLRGEVGREKVYVHEEGFYAEHDIELLLGRTAVSLDTREPRAGARRRRAAALRPAAVDDRRRAAPAPRSRAPSSTGSSTCAASADSDALRERLDRGGAVVVVGAGWIGAEVAASARQRGLDVTVVEPASRTARARARHGDRRHLPRHPRRPRRADADWAPASRRSRATARSSVCARATAASSTATSSSSASACSRAPSSRPTAGLAIEQRHSRRRAPSDKRARRLRRRRRGQRPPSLLRRADPRRALGQRAQPGPGRGPQHARPAAAYDRLPYFFSDQYDVGMEYSGFARGWDRVVFRGDPASREFVAFWLLGDRVVAGMNVNVWDVTDPIQRLIRERVAVDDRRLADPDLPLERARPATRGGVA